MELTKEELQKVENYLKTKGVEHIDVRVEVLDHILTDIETLIEEKEYGFERAYRVVRFKWDKHLVKRSSFYFGVIYEAPKIVLNKAVKEFKKFFFILITSYFLPVIMLLKSNIKVSDNVKFFLNITMSIITIAFVLLFIDTYYKNSKLKQKTTYSFILKTQKLSLMFLIFPFIGQEIIDENNVFNSIYLGLILAFLCIAIITRYFYYKHVSIISKYKLI